MQDLLVFQGTPSKEGLKWQIDEYSNATVHGAGIRAISKMQKEVVVFQ